jgi:hypothetical protein
MGAGDNHSMLQKLSKGGTAAVSVIQDFRDFLNLKRNNTPPEAIMKVFEELYFFAKIVLDVDLAGELKQEVSSNFCPTNTSAKTEVLKRPKAERPPQKSPNYAAFFSHENKELINTFCRLLGLLERKNEITPQTISKSTNSATFCRMFGPSGDGRSLLLDNLKIFRTEARRTLTKDFVQYFNDADNRAELYRLKRAHKSNTKKPTIDPTLKAYYEGRANSGGKRPSRPQLAPPPPPSPSPLSKLA